jgi:hypothetical protein
MPVQTKIEKLSNAHCVVRGLKKHYVRGDVLMLDGAALERDEVIARFDEQVAAIDGVLQAWGAWQAALRRERGLREPMRNLTTSLKARVWVDKTRSAYAAFGWPTPKKPGPKTAAAKFAGVQKRAKKRAAK